MQELQGDTMRGLHRYQIQQHKHLLHGLELERRYCMKEIEQQQKRYSRALERLRCSVSSLGSRTNNPWRSTQPRLSEAQAASCSILVDRVTMDNKAFEKAELYSDTGSPSSDFHNSSNAVMNKVWWRQPPTWATLTFADLRQKHMAIVQTTEPFRRWQHLLLSNNCLTQKSSFGQQDPYNSNTTRSYNYVLRKVFVSNASTQHIERKKQTDARDEKYRTQ